MSVAFKPWDAAEFLDTPERISAYIEAVLEDGDPAMIAAAIDDIARAKGMAQIACETGRSQESLYRALSEERGAPEIPTLMAVLKALGLQPGIRLPPTEA